MSAESTPHGPGIQLKTNLFLIVVNHNIVRLHIPVHDSLAVTEVQCLQKLVDIITHVIVGEAGVEHAEVRVVHVFENQARRFALAIANDIKQGYHVGATRQVLKNLDLTLNLLLLDWLQDLDDTLLVVDHIDALEHFRVFSAAYQSMSLALTIRAKRERKEECSKNKKQKCGKSLHTYLADHFVVFQNTPRNVHTIVVPIGPGHMLIDIGIDARHDEWQLSSNFKVSETTHNQSISTRKCGGVGIRTATRAKGRNEKRNKKRQIEPEDRQQQLQDQESTDLSKARSRCYRPDEKREKMGRHRQSTTDTVGSSGDDRDWRSVVPLWSRGTCGEGAGR